MVVKFNKESTLSLEERMEALEIIVFETKKLVVDKQSTIESMISELTEALAKCEKLYANLLLFSQPPKLLSEPNLLSDPEFITLKGDVSQLKMVFHSTLQQYKSAEYLLTKY